MYMRGFGFVAMRIGFDGRAHSVEGADCSLVGVKEGGVWEDGVGWGDVFGEIVDCGRGVFWRMNC